MPIPKGDPVSVKLTKSMTVVTFNKSYRIGLSRDGSLNVRQPFCQIAAISTK
jgi:hypothetical protein